jgi:hypothetical protein
MKDKCGIRRTCGLDLITFLQIDSKNEEKEVCSLLIINPSVAFGPSENYQEQKHHKFTIERNI